MRHLRLFGAALCVAFPAAAGADPAPVKAAAPQSAVEQLMAADTGYSTAGANVNLIDAIGAMFDEAVIMPLPTATFAKGKPEALAALARNPANATSKASWAPVRAGISADGQHGFTYGFMTITEPGKPDRRAKYLAYWVHRPAGWKVALYKRGGSGAGEVQTALRPPAVPPAQVAAVTDDAAVAVHRASLAAREKRFSDRAQDVGLGQAFREFGSADAMNMGGKPDFTYGNEAIAADMPPDAKSPVVWAADEGVLVASSGDLGVTWGFIRFNAPQPGQPAAIPFFTVWRRDSVDQAWRYVAE
jgi:ketosteroid isomerase-like protein